MLNSSKTMDSEKASALTASGNEKAEKPGTATSLKTKISQHSLVRRRKISVPEVGPMTTVHEVPMDSRMQFNVMTPSATKNLWLTSPLYSYDSRATAPS